MRFVLQPDKRTKQFISGRGFAFSNKRGEIFNSIKQRVPTSRSAIDQLPSSVEQRIDSAIATAENDPRSPIPVGYGDKVKKAVKEDIRNLVHKGAPIPNSEALVREAVQNVPIQDIVNKVSGRGRSKGASKPLSSLLASTKAPPKKGKGIRLHGEGLVLHGTGFAYA